MLGRKDKRKAGEICSLPRSPPCVRGNQSSPFELNWGYLGPQADPHSHFLSPTLSSDGLTDSGFDSWTCTLILQLSLVAHPTQCKQEMGTPRPPPAEPQQEVQPLGSRQREVGKHPSPAEMSRPNCRGWVSPSKPQHLHFGSQPAKVFRALPGGNQ